ncbi:MAG: hypothetical protein VB031_03025 [Eubacteriaceae bacterium]|nr:hypothetical protein [Eubacteriaceae bacterium]
MACPLTWIVVAIVAVVAILIVLQKKFNIFGKLWGIMKGFGKWIAGGFVGAIGKAKKKIVEFGSNAKKYFGSRLKATFDGAKKIVSGFKEHFSKKIKQAAAASKLIETKCGKSVHGAKGILGGMNKFITGVFTGNWKKAWKGVVQVFKTILNGIKDGVKKPLNFAIDLINKFLGALNKIHVKLPKKLGGGTIGFNIPTIPKLAKGTRNFQGGGAWVGENGPEYVEMPKGSRVNTAGESRRMSGNSINVAKLADTVIVREEADINKIAYEFAKQLNEMMPDAV